MYKEKSLDYRSRLFFYYCSAVERRCSTSVAVGNAAIAPFRVAVRAPAALAQRRASSMGIFSDRHAASAPQKASPAAVASSALIVKAGRD